MPDLKISQLTAATTPVAGTEVLPIVQSGSTVKVSVANLTAGRSVSAADLTASTGNLTFSSTAQRITGDFSNATLTNRLAFQTSTVNGNTSVAAIPNGTSVQSNLRAFNNSDPTNASFADIGVDTTVGAFVRADRAGSGTYLPMTFFTGGSERVRIDTSGNVGIGTTSPSTKLSISTAAATDAVRWTDGVNSTGLLSTTTGASTLWATAALAFGAGAASFTERMRITATGNVVAGGSVALATTATDGFLYVPTCAGTPTGVPTAITGMAPIVVNTTNNKLYFYSGGAWRDAGP